jgi:hypothetical protein
VSRSIHEDTRQSTVEVALVADPLSQRKRRADDGFVEDMLARTIELLHELRTLAFGPQAVVFWPGLLVVCGAMLAWSRWPPAVGASTPVGDVLTRLQGSVCTCRGQTWPRVDSVPPEVQAIAQERTVLATRVGSTMRLEAGTLAMWRRRRDGSILVTLGAGRVHIEAKELIRVAFPGGVSAEEGGTAMDVWVQKSATLISSLESSVDVQPGGKLAPGRSLSISHTAPPVSGALPTDDTGWEVWNHAWTAGHPSVTP